ncbi:unnamed protein product [Linum trigynum]|uniref:Uncharacterized protein n=1 Tax=Linum trigynum TaxID=586398 RepID=A0AAV2FZ81_9ROSI
MPPAPARCGSPEDAPSTLIFVHPGGGGLHPIAAAVRKGGPWRFPGLKDGAVQALYQNSALIRIACVSERWA